MAYSTSSSRTHYLLFIFFLLIAAKLSNAFIYIGDDFFIHQVTDHNHHHGHDNKLSRPDLLWNARQQFSIFMKTYGKTYPTQKEQNYRFSVFKSNLLLAARHQERDPSAVHGVTRFSDLTQIEFRTKFLEQSAGSLLNRQANNNKAPILPTNDLPKDFFDHGVAATPIENQMVSAVSHDEDQIAANLVKNGPVAVRMNGIFMQTYTGGISCPSTCSKHHPNHDAFLVGFGEVHTGTEEKPYWIIKNSLGPHLGEDGYYKLCRGHNACGVASTVSTSTPATTLH